MVTDRTGCRIVPGRRGQGYIPGAQLLPLRVSAMASIADQLHAYHSTLSEARTRGDEATVRKLEQQIRDLEAFGERHPEAAEAPSPLELFCDLNPSNPNCLVYDD